MMIRRKRLLTTLHKVDRLHDSACQVGMVCIDAGIDHSDANTPAGCPRVSSVGSDNPRSILKMGIRISRKHSQTLENLIRLN
jgi:hypothetical protein